MKVVEFKPVNTFAEAAEVLHKFESDLMSGKVAGFFIAALDAEDIVTAYVSTTRPVTRLRMAGAMQHALHMFNHGDEV